MSAQLKPSGPDYMGRMDQYCADVLSGKRAAGKLEILMVQRHYQDLARAQNDPDCPFYFDEWHACDFLSFFEMMPHVEGVWKTPTLEAEGWQCFVFGSIYGWRRKSDGLRRFDTVYWEIGRKNAKSAGASVVALYGLTCEGEVGPQVKTAATTGEQARIVYTVCKKMADKLPQFREAFGIRAMMREIESSTSGGNIRPINAKASTQDGLNVSVTIMDELHAHDTRDLFDVLRSARGARQNPLSFYITTAGYNIHGVCFEQRRLAVQILESTIELDHYFAAIFTIDEGDDEFDPAIWPKANPNFGVSISPHEFEGYAKEAKASPESLNEFRTKRLNVWGGAKTAWLPMDKWQQCNGAVELDELESVPCYGAFDLSSTADTTAKVLVWRVDGRFKVWPRIYVPEAAIEPRSVKFSLPYDMWRDQGFLVVTPGDVLDYAYIEKDIKADLDRFDVKELAYDPWNSTDLVNRLVEEDAPMVEFRQGAGSYNEPMRQLEMAVIGGKLDHGGHPVLNWMASNIIARRDVNDNMAPDRKNSKEKIDGICALLMALGRLLVNEGDDLTEIPDDFELIVL